jgi:hypothetical protein
MTMGTRVIMLAFICLGLFFFGCDDDDEGQSLNQGPVVGLLDIGALDPSFETYDGANSDVIFENGYTGRINASAAFAHDGALSVHFEDVEQQEIRFPNHLHPDKVPLTPGASYVLRVWAYGVDVGGSATTANVSVQLAAVLYDGATFVGVGPSMTENLTSFGQWEELEMTFTMPEGADRAYMGIEATAEVPINVDLYLDEISVERTS